VRNFFAEARNFSKYYDVAKKKTHSFFTHASRRLVSIDIWESFCDIDSFRAESITTARGIYECTIGPILDIENMNGNYRNTFTNINPS